jgi:hypothetical protein
MELSTVVGERPAAKPAAQTSTTENQYDKDDIPVSPGKMCNHREKF